MANRHLMRVTALFFSFMAVLTFCSRTIYRQLLPCVEVERAASGMLRYEHIAADIRIMCGDGRSVQIPALLARQLTVRTVCVRPNQRLEVGDGVVEFHGPDGEYLLKDGQVKLAQAEAALAAWQSDVKDRLAQAKAALKKAKKAERDKLSREIALLEGGNMGGTTLAVLEHDVAQWRDVLSALEGLRDAGWALKADAAGYVAQILIKEGDGYMGLAPLATLCPDGQPYMVGAVWKEAPNLNLSGWTIQGGVQGAAPLTAAHISTEGTGQTIWFDCQDDTPAPDQLDSIRLTADSPYYAALVPGKALAEGHVYVLKSKRGAWGQPEHYAQQVKVIQGPGDGTHTAILGGLGYSDLIITSWNKPIRDGDTVVLSSYA